MLSCVKKLSCLDICMQHCKRENSILLLQVELLMQYRQDYWFMLEVTLE